MILSFREKIDLQCYPSGQEFVCTYSCGSWPGCQHHSLRATPTVSWTQCWTPGGTISSPPHRSRSTVCGRRSSRWSSPWQTRSYMKAFIPGIDEVKIVWRIFTFAVRLLTRLTRLVSGMDAAIMSPRLDSPGTAPRPAGRFCLVLWSSLKRRQRTWLQPCWQRKARQRADTRVHRYAGGKTSPVWSSTPRNSSWRNTRQQSTPWMSWLSLWKLSRNDILVAGFLLSYWPPPSFSPVLPRTTSNLTKFCQ